MIPTNHITVSGLIWTNERSPLYYQVNKAWVFVNGEEIPESEHDTYYYDSEGHVSSLGSRTLYMRLEAGDTLSLRTGEVGYGLWQISLCFELAQVDSIPPM